MKIESLLYERIDNNKLRCHTCQRRCIIDEGSKGWCLSRVNEKGKLYSIIYGEVSCLSINPIEKKPVFHFYPGSKWLSLGSFGCNFRCLGCQNWEIAHWKGGELSSKYISAQEEVKRAKERGCMGISWTFNEPTLWFEYTLDSAKLAKAEGLYTNYVTNGFITHEALDMIAPFLDVYRVDIKGFSDETYSKIGNIKGFKGILETVERAKRQGMHIECVTNIIPGLNDKEEELRGIASWIKERLGSETPWHITRFYPAFKFNHIPPTPLSLLERAWSIGKEEGLWYVYIGNVPGHKYENTYCHNCGELLIERYIFDILKNNIRNNRCQRCNTLIPGRFMK